MNIRYNEPVVSFNDARYTVNGAYLGAALVSDPCYVALRVALRTYRIARVPRDHRVSRLRRIYRAVLTCGKGRRG